MLSQALVIGTTAGLASVLLDYIKKRKSGGCGSMHSAVREGAYLAAATAGAVLIAGIVLEA